MSLFPVIMDRQAGPLRVGRSKHRLHAFPAYVPIPLTSALGSIPLPGLTIEPGLYTWGTGISITTDVTLWGSDTAT